MPTRSVERDGSLEPDRGLVEELGARRGTKREAFEIVEHPLRRPTASLCARVAPLPGSTVSSSVPPRIRDGQRARDTQRCRHRQTNLRSRAMPTQAEAMRPPMIRPVLREATPEDGEDCARIFYDAFESIATRHNLPIEPPSRDFTRFIVAEMLANEGFAGLVADRGGEVIGSAFVD